MKSAELNASGGSLARSPSKARCARRRRGALSPRSAAPPEVTGMAGGVCERQLGAVGGPVERHPLDAERLASRLHVLDPVEGAVEVAARPERGRARLHGRSGIAVAGLLERGAAKETGA